ncbi:uncharacterized protein LOC127265894 [Andrographis paniculata]|uniref:uncharacterized protein LOC127265894 n=1 Tax=Andrographis paniculata TaxID=175694 RepID=UPI0021E8CAD5|nr:uncharacterized protein LOC127265894 [Andrographis paniculata]
MGLENTIAWDKNSPSQDRAKAMIFLCHHIDEALKMQYVTLESPLKLWERLKERYDHLKLTLLPRARSECSSIANRGFQKYSELITCLLLAEQNNELLLKNHESRATGANPFPEANAIQPENPVRGRGRPYRPQQRINTGRNRNNDDECTWCGIKGHWAHVCHTASHLAELYRASKERQGRVAAETNYAAHNDTFDDVMNENITHLDADDLLDIADDVK